MTKPKVKTEVVAAMDAKVGVVAADVFVPPAVTHKRASRKHPKDENVVTDPVAQDGHEEGGIRWQEPFPTEGMVKVELLEDHGISEGRLVKQYPKGAVVTISAELAHSIHKSIKGV